MNIKTQIRGCTKAPITERFSLSDSFIWAIKDKTYYKCREKADVSVEFVCFEAIEKVLLNENRS